MRRKDKEITDPIAIAAILKSCYVMHLAMVDAGNPYLVPLNYGYDGECIYFHSAPIGRKIDVLKANNKVCFEVSTNEKLIIADRACEYGFQYTSVIGFGKVRFIESMDEILKAYKAIMFQCTGKIFTDFDADAIRRTCIGRIDIEHLIAKKSGG